MSVLTVCPYLACSRLSESGEEAKEKGTRKVGGAGKRKRFPVFFSVSPRFIFVFALSSIQRTRQSRSMEQAQSPWWVELKMYGTKQTDRNNYEVSVS